MTAINMDTQLFTKALQEGGKPVLVEFWAPWCVYCRRIAPAFDEVSQELSEALIAGRVNIDENPALADREQVELIPTLILYRDGKRIGSVTAPKSKAELREFIDRSL